MANNNDHFTSLWAITSNYLAGLDHEAQQQAIKKTGTDELCRIYDAALQRDDFEICGIVKEELVSRGVDHSEPKFGSGTV